MPAQGQVPSTRPPGYGAEYATQQAAFDANSAARLKAEMEANSTAFNSVISHAKDIAEVSGGSITPDRLLHMFAGAKDTPIFGTPYAQQADSARMAKTMAEIGALHRSGTGGGGGNNDPRKNATLQSDETMVEVSDKDGNVVQIRPMKMSEIRENRNRYKEEGGYTIREVFPFEGQRVVVPNNDPRASQYVTTLPDLRTDVGQAAPPPDETAGLSERAVSNLAVARDGNPDVRVGRAENGAAIAIFPDGSTETLD